MKISWDQVRTTVLHSHSIKSDRGSIPNSCNVFDILCNIFWNIMLCITCFDIFRVFQYALKCRFPFNHALDNIMDLLHIFKISSESTFKGKHHNEIHKSLLTTDEFIWFLFCKDGGFGRALSSANKHVL